MYESVDIGSIKIKNNKKDVYNILWTIDWYFFRLQNEEAVWYSPIFCLLGGKWCLVLHPYNEKYYISLHMKSMTPEIPVPSLVYTAGIMNKDDSFHTYTEPEIASGDNFGTTKLLYDPKVKIKTIAPDGNVTFFMTACLQKTKRTSHAESENGEEDYEISMTENSIPDTVGGKDNYKISLKEKRISYNLDIFALMGNIADLFLEKKNFDVILKVGNRELKAHRTILLARAPVLACMLKHVEEDDLEGNKRCIVIKDCDPDVFYMFLSYLYTAKVNELSNDNVIALYTIAYKYDVKALCAHCVYFMLNSLCVDNFRDIFCFALKHCESVLIKAGQKFFIDNKQAVIESESFGLFMKEKPEIVKELLCRSSNSVFPYSKKKP